MQATPQEYQFHQRLCTRSDPIAFAELADWLYSELVQDVRKRAGYAADPILIEEAVGQALLDYRDKPERYDPHRMDLQGYLVMSAYRDFQNARAREERVQLHQISLFDPSLQEDERLESLENLNEQLDVEELWAIIVSHVRSPEPYIQLLRLEHVTGDEQLRQVRLAKYRVARRLRRNLSRWLAHTEGEA